MQQGSTHSIPCSTLDHKSCHIRQVTQLTHVSSSTLLGQAMCNQFATSQMHCTGSSSSGAGPAVQVARLQPETLSTTSKQGHRPLKPQHEDVHLQHQPIYLHAVGRHQCPDLNTLRNNRVLHTSWSPLQHQEESHVDLVDSSAAWIVHQSCALFQKVECNPGIMQQQTIYHLHTHNP